MFELPIAVTDPSVIAAVQQAKAAWASVDAANQALVIAWVSTAVNALVVITAFVVPMVQRHLALKDESARDDFNTKVALEYAIRSARLVSNTMVHLWSLQGNVLNGRPSALIFVNRTHDLEVCERGLELQLERRLDDLELIDALISLRDTVQSLRETIGVFPQFQPGQEIPQEQIDEFLRRVTKASSAKMWSDRAYATLSDLIDRLGVKRLAPEESYFEAEKAAGARREGADQADSAG